VSSVARNESSSNENIGIISSWLLGPAALLIKKVGLLWAARSNFLAAATTAFADFADHGDITRPTLMTVREIAWIELQLGRIPAALQWAQLTDIVARHLMLEGNQKENFLNRRRDFDIILGILLLNLDIGNLHAVSMLPNILEHLRFDYARIALLFALGYEKTLREEGWIPESETPDSFQDIMVQWASQPAKDQVASTPLFLDQMTVSLSTHVIGCRVNITAPNNLADVFLAETVLSALEAFLATSLNEAIYPYRSTLDIRLRPALFNEGDPTISAKIVDGGSVEVTRTGNLNFASFEARKAFKSSVLTAIAIIVFQIAVIPEAHIYLDQLGEEDAFSRAIDFSDIAISVERILGATPKMSISDWQKEYAGEPQFLVQRKLPWNHALPPVVVERERRERPLDPENMKHSGRRVMSVIDIPLWDKAKWKAVAYVGSDDPSQPPLLALAFEDEAAAVQIFGDWRRRMKESGEKTDMVRVAILRDVDKSAPHAYTVTIGSEVSEAAKAAPDGLLAIFRIQHMLPSNSRGLDTFLREYQRVGSYVLAPAVFVDKDKGGTPLRFLAQYGILQTKLVVRSAWEVGDNDPDMMALMPENDPIIPEGVTDPPIYAALRRIKAKRGIRSEARPASR
jgi:hypothetical protein